MSWKTLPLGAVATLQRGFDLPADLRKNGPYPVISSGGITGCHSEARVSGPGVVTGRYGSIGEVYFVEGDYWPLNTTLWVKDFHGNEPKFVFHLLRAFDFKKFSDKTGVPGVNRNDLHKVLVSCPPIDVQKRIIEYIGLWDTAIENTERLIEAKRLRYIALSNKLLRRISKDVSMSKFLKPTLRAVSKPAKSYWALGIRSHCKGTFRRFVENPNSVVMDTLYRVKHDDLIVNITFAWEGAIAFVEKMDEDCFVSHRFPTYEVDVNKALPDYLRHVIVQKRFIRNLGLISPGGAGRNRVLNKKDFLNLKISLPKVSEQEKIGDVLNASLKEISLLQTKLELLKKQKRGLMQKLLTGTWRIKP